MRSNELSDFPVQTAVSPEFVIGGGNIIRPGTGTYHDDLRVAQTYIHNAMTPEQSTYDPRGTLDGYPIRCVKP